MARFKPNQEVVCIAYSLSFQNGPKWWQVWKRRMPIGPKYNEIVTIERYVTNDCVYLVEYPQIQGDGRGGFMENIFEPLLTNEELYKAINEESVKA